MRSFFHTSADPLKPLCAASSSLDFAARAGGEYVDVGKIREQTAEKIGGYSLGCA